jgi:protein arginine kinase
MDLTDLFIGPVPWIAKGHGSKTANPRVVCTVFTTCRNLSFYPFLPVLSPDQKAEIQKKLTDIMTQKELKHAFLLRECSALELDLLKERFLLPQLFIDSVLYDGKEAGFEHSSLALSEEGKISALINVKEHLTYSIYEAGFEEQQENQIMLKIKNDLSGQTWASDSQLGYLFSEPSIIGSGFKISALIHFPGIYNNRQQEQFLRALAAVGLTGLGHGDLAGDGAMVWLSSGGTLGCSEKQIYSDFTERTAKFLILEEEIEQKMYKKDKARTEDSIFRAFYLLLSARILPYSELLKLSSWVKLGVYLELLKPDIMEPINLLQVKSSSAHIQLGESSSLSPEEKDEIRASTVRLTLKNYCD